MTKTARATAAANELSTDQARWAEVGDLLEEIGAHCLRADRILDYLHSVGPDLDVFDATQFEVLQTWLVGGMQKAAVRGCAIVTEVERENGWRPSMVERSLAGGIAPKADDADAEVRQ